MGRFNYQKEYKNWKWNIPDNYNIGYDCVDKHTETEKKNKIALYWENEQGFKDKFTYNDLKNLTNKFGNALKNIGFKKGDRFLIRLPNIPHFQISFLGGVKIGAIPIPSNIRLKAGDIEYRIKDSGSKSVITTPRYVKEVNEIKENCPTLENIIVIGEAYENQYSYDNIMKSASNNLDIEPTNKDDMAFFSYTVVNTGNFNAAVHLHRWVPVNDPSVLFWQQVKEDDIIAHTGDLNWVYPLGNGFLFPWRHGCSTFIYGGRFHPEHWFELIERYNISNLASVPTAYKMLVEVKDAEKKYDLSHLKHCISAGELSSPEITKKWKQKFNLDIYEGIGMTEIMVYLSNFNGMKIKQGSYGKPHPGKICTILSKEGKPLKRGEHGVLAIKQSDPGLFKEYWNNPDKTMKKFKNGWFITGDMFYQDNDGYYWLSEKNKRKQLKELRN